LFLFPRFLEYILPLYFYILGYLDNR